MVKSITVNFDDGDYDLLVQAKSNLSWREFILTLVKPQSTQESHQNAFNNGLEQEDIN